MTNVNVAAESLYVLPMIIIAAVVLVVWFFNWID
jgi:hypothetical protein